MAMTHHPGTECLGKSGGQEGGPGGPSEALILACGRTPPGVAGFIRSGKFMIKWEGGDSR